MTNRRSIAIIVLVMALLSLVYRCTRTPPGERGSPQPTVASRTGDPTTYPATIPATAGSTATAAPTRADEAPGPPAAATSVHDGDLVDVATGFASAWVRHQGPDSATWLKRLETHTTQALADRLSSVDPDTVPATSITGTPEITATANLATATIKTDAGLLTLTLIHTNHWLVSAVDWTRP